MSPNTNRRPAQGSRCPSPPGRIPNSPEALAGQARPLVMGIVNTTPDSFSGDGRDPRAAVGHGCAGLVAHADLLEQRCDTSLAFCRREVEVEPQDLANGLPNGLARIEGGIRILKDHLGKSGSLLARRRPAS